MTCSIIEYVVRVVCLHDAANAAGEEFVPYFPQAIDALRVYLVNVETEDQRKVQIQAIGNTSSPL